MQLAVNALQLRPGNVVADLGCGHGGPGLWAARQTGAMLIGIDLSPAGIELARRQATQLGLDGQARFLVSDLTATGLPDASCDAVISLDVLLFVPHKATAAREIARILRPGRAAGLHHLGTAIPCRTPLISAKAFSETLPRSGRPSWSRKGFGLPRPSSFSTPTRMSVPPEKRKIMTRLSCPEL